jgi:hypothetical protein
MSGAFLYLGAKLFAADGPPVLRAIETRYAGRRFRSRREARWAILFDHLEVDWRYEPEGYDLGGNVFYLPDFELHLPGGERQWVEVKPDLAPYPQLSMLCDQSAHLGVLVAEPTLSTAVLMCNPDGTWQPPSPSLNWIRRLSGGQDRLSCQAACNAALSARWEHGEQPRRPSKRGGRGPRVYERAERLLDQRSGVGSTWNF